MTTPAIHTLVDQTIACLAAAGNESAHIGDMLETIKTVYPDGGSLMEVTGSIPAHAALLDQAISSIPKDPFGPLKQALSAARALLRWRVDDGGFYADGANVGDGYTTGNMHALLIGPKDSPVKADDFLLGFFLLAPKTLYRDHKHLAPEAYIPLTGPSGWRFDLGNWQDHEAGSVIYNAPEITHATRVYETPFLALFAWERDIGSPCSVVPADDWEKIDTDLRNS